MAHMTITSAVKDALEDLKRTDFDEFRFQLLDRREEPRVRRAAVEGKNVLDVTDVLVSTFTEPGARQVTLEILRQINCNQEADALESKTKMCMDNGDPTLRRSSNGKLETRPSQEAMNCKASQWLRQPIRREEMKKPEEVEDEAKACIRSEGGDVCNRRLILSRSVIQFGQYKGKTFKWLLENDVGYTASLVASHQRERGHTMDQSPHTANKDALTQYAIAYPDVQQEVRFHLRQKPANKTQTRRVLAENTRRQSTPSFKRRGVRGRKRT